MICPVVTYAPTAATKPSIAAQPLNLSASGIGFPITDELGAKIKVKYESNDGKDNKYEVKTGLKYKF